ncbi:MAG: 16S rRNA (cytosine(1402)-N(4))-methyltransferase [Proteobacteria bacterium]|nr:16S rRNA (cytosine(1402)-N(4))-methyltransferase [Pseudomonadota bacterium]
MEPEEQEESVHCSVLPAEILHYLAPRSGGLYVDGTLGLGGHTEAILRHSAPDGRVIAFEWDEDAISSFIKIKKPACGGML